MRDEDDTPPGPRPDPSNPAPRALLITSHPPDPDLYGGTQRALAWTRALAHRYTLDLLELRPMALRPEVEAGLGDRLSLPRAAWWDPAAVLGWVLVRLAPGAFVRWTGWRRFWRGVTRVHLRRARRLLGSRRYQVVVAYTLEGAIWAEALAKELGGAQWVLDLPDVESAKLGRDVALLEEQGEAREAALVACEAQACERLEEDLVGRFSRVFVCSEPERGRLVGRFPRSDIRVAPNVAGTRPRAGTPAAGGAPLRLLMVGDMEYLPNRDAARFFLEEVGPVLSRERGGGWRLDLVGRGSEHLAEGEGGASGRVHGHGWQADLVPFYERTDVVVVPVRTGGGTRTKVLEAFQVGRPVVSTTLGVEGLAVVPGRHLVVADSGDEFAVACMRLADDVALRGRVVEAARQLVDSCYGQAAFDAAVLDAAPRGSSG